mgnify:CR=1 FL=1
MLKFGAIGQLLGCVKGAYVAIATDFDYFCS